MLIEITTETIKLSQLLKKMRLIETGGRAKFFLEEHEVIVNGEKTTSRNKTIRTNDVLWIDDEVYKIINKTANV
ncbi:RNA-binding S4 domain-containing protein [Mycoplasma phocoenae]|uniref:RNA-binding S4 domain-containing protein n=1 Tax=Mycoplasma phocoenae TaxID=754517 RepID=A0A858U939_9MOLU|nr:RNA-binding S4 domain-containing protein [Mycoplasma phocoenae]QJG67216.1 RNA-binding S4 domain-containing protein [Mycoplasma phocoenae]